MKNNRKLVKFKVNAEALTFIGVDNRNAPFVRFTVLFNGREYNFYVHPKYVSFTKAGIIFDILDDGKGNITLYDVEKQAYIKAKTAVILSKVEGGLIEGVVAMKELSRDTKNKKEELDIEFEEESEDEFDYLEL